MQLGKRNNTALRAHTARYRSHTLKKVPAVAGERIQHKVYDVRVLQRPSRRDDEAIRRVILFVMFPHSIPRNLHNLLRSTTNRATQRVLAHKLFYKILEGNVRRIILVHGNLFQNYPALLLQMFWIEQSVTHHISQDINRHRGIVVKYTRIIAGMFLRGESV